MFSRSHYYDIWPTEDPVWDAERFCQECEEGRKDHQVYLTVMIPYSISARSREEAIDLGKQKLGVDMDFANIKDYIIEDADASLA